jgi:hypothetical protein
LEPNTAVMAGRRRGKTTEMKIHLPCCSASKLSNICDRRKQLFICTLSRYRTVHTIHGLIFLKKSCKDKVQDSKEGVTMEQGLLCDRVHDIFIVSVHCTVQYMYFKLEIPEKRKSVLTFSRLFPFYLYRSFSPLQKS